MDLNGFNDDLLAFLNASPTPFHAVQQMAARLNEAGFELLAEADAWCVQKGGRYYVIRNGTSIVAFSLDGEPPLDSGFRMVGAHTDSPCLKVKPTPELHRKGYLQLGVEVYGGVLLNPWFDRDLSLAGRVNFKKFDSDKVHSVLVDYRQAIASIPSLAIHLDREANNQHSINPQKDLPPILMQVEEGGGNFRDLLLKQLHQQHPQCQAEQVLDYELFFYDTQPAAIIGLEQQFIASARLDNLLSCYIGLKALIHGRGQNTLLVCNDHEEVGSQSATGAQGPMLKSVLLRLLDTESDFFRVMDRSMMISADNAHGVHPNFIDRHDGNHGPLLNRGPVIKSNANQRYATNSDTSSLFRQWCEQVNEPVQSFVVRSDMGCGSTVGPITASVLGVKTLDVGVPTFAMHSIREMAGSKDGYSLYNILSAFYAVDDVSIESL